MSTDPVKISSSQLDTISQLYWNKFLVRENYAYRRSLFKDNVLDFQLSTYLKDHIGLVVADKTFSDSLMSDFKSLCKHPEYVLIIEKVYQNALRLTPGNQAPSISFPNSGGVINSLAELKVLTVTDTLENG